MPPAKAAYPFFYFRKNFIATVERNSIIFNCYRRNMWRSRNRFLLIIWCGSPFAFETESTPTISSCACWKCKLTSRGRRSNPPKSSTVAETRSRSGWENQLRYRAEKDKKKKGNPFDDYADCSGGHDLSLDYFQSHRVLCLIIPLAQLMWCIPLGQHCAPLKCYGYVDCHTVGIIEANLP